MLTITSWNVHHFSFLGTRDSSNTAPLIRKALTDHNIDIACFQEVAKAEFLKEFGGPETKSFYAPAPGPYIGNGVVLVNKSIAMVEWSYTMLDNDRNVLKILIEFQGKRVWVLCTHLDHQSEERRMRQTQKLIQELPKDEIPLLLVGDFNALNRADYTADEWLDMDRERRVRGWELCASDVVPYLKEVAKLKDLCGANPIRGSRFATRIDYIFGRNVNDIVTTDFQIPDCSDYSDHENICICIRL